MDKKYEEKEKFWQQSEENDQLTEKWMGEIPENVHIKGAILQLSCSYYNYSWAEVGFVIETVRNVESFRMMMFDNWEEWMRSSPERQG